MKHVADLECAEGILHSLHSLLLRQPTARIHRLQHLFSLHLHLQATQPSCMLDARAVEAPTCKTARRGVTWYRECNSTKLSVRVTGLGAEHVEALRCQGSPSLSGHSQGAKRCCQAPWAAQGGDEHTFARLSRFTVSSYRVHVSRAALVSWPANSRVFTSKHSCSSRPELHDSQRACTTEQ